MSVLAGTDFSVSSFRAADAAAAIAHARNETLVLAHFAGGRVSAGAGARMLSEVTRLETACRVRGWFEEGPVTGRRFADVAQQMRAALVVIGEHEASGWRLSRGHLVGSTSSDVMAHLPQVPLLIVRSDTAYRLCRPSPKMLALFALDETDEGIFETLALLSGAGFAHLDAVHFSALPKRQPARHQAMQVIEEVLVEHLGSLPSSVHLRRIIVEDARVGIEDACAAHGLYKEADLIVCGSHHRHGLARSWHGSVAGRVIRRAPVSVVIAQAANATSVRRSD